MRTEREKHSKIDFPRNTWKSPKVVISQRKYNNFNQASNGLNHCRLAWSVMSFRKGMTSTFRGSEV